jgi:hypothetical protein
VAPAYRRPLATAHSSLSPSRYQWGRLVGATLFHVCVLSLTVSRALLVSSETRSLARSLSDPWGPFVGPFPSEALVLSPWTHPRPHDFRPRPHAPESFLDPALVHSPCPAQLRPQPSTLVLSLAQRVHLRSSVAARHGLAPILRSPSSPHLVHCLGKLRLITCNPGRPSVCPLPLWFAWSALIGAFLTQPQFCRCRPASLSCPERRSRVPEPPLKVTVLTPPLFSPVLHLLARDCSPECSPVCRGLPLHRPAASPLFCCPDPAIVFAESSPTFLAT